MAGRPSRSRPVRWPARIVAVLGALVLSLVGTAGPALAHDVLISSDPADGAVLDSAPTTVSFTFDQPIQNFNPVLVVIGPNGNAFTDGSPTISGDVISAPVLAGPAGRYRAVYRIVSADGHPVTGQISYTLSGQAAGTATGTPTGAGTAGPPASADAGHPAGHDPSGSATSSGTSPWLWVGIGIAAALLVAALAVALRRQRPE